MVEGVEHFLIEEPIRINRSEMGNSHLASVCFALVDLPGLIQAKHAIIFSKCTVVHVHVL